MKWDGQLTDDDVMDAADDDTDDWILRELVPRREPWLLVGKWKGGKTWLALSLALAVASGQPWQSFENCFGRCGRVLLVMREDNRKRVMKRLRQLARGMGIRLDDERLRRNLRVTDTEFRLPRDAADFIEAQRDFQPDLILIDSLSRVFIGSQNNIGDAAAFTEAWHEVGRELDASVGFIHHTNKGWDGDVPTLDDIRGSGDLTAFPRHLVMMKAQRGAEAANHSTVALMGNLDVQREPFVLQYERHEDENSRVSVTLTERGTAKERKRIGADERKARATSKSTAQRQLALRIIGDQGVCSAAKLKVEADANGTSLSNKTWEKEITSLKLAGLVTTSRKGTSLTDAGRAALA